MISFRSLANAGKRVGLKSSRRSIRRVGQRRPALLSIECLEERNMLAGVVGVFERLDGTTEAWAYAEAHTASPPPVTSFPSPSTSDDSATSYAAATKQESDPDGTAIAEANASAIILAQIATTIPIPQVTAGALINVLASDAATAKAGSAALAQATFQYIPDPNSSEDLIFHGFLYLGLSGPNAPPDHPAAFSQGENTPIVQIGNGVDRARISAFWSGNTNSWHYSGFVPGQGNISGSGAVLSLLYHYTTSDIPDATTPFIASPGGDFFASGNGEGLAAGIWSMATGAWGYVTAEGEDRIPGDFNGDNEVNEVDFQLWESGSPLADATGNGIVDCDDYLVWLANTSTLIVSTDVDENDSDFCFGDLSLREAIGLANSNSHVDKILFHEDLLDSTIELSLGEISIDADVAIIGLGAEHLTIEGRQSSEARIFSVTSSSTVTISDMTLTGGRTTSGQNGGAIYNSGDLTIDAVTIVDNLASSYGGGVYSHTGASIALIDSIVAENSATYGGGLYILNNDDVTIRRSSIEDNYAIFSEGGLAIVTPASLLIESSAIIDNSSDRYVGGISVVNPTGAVIKNTTISGNSAKFPTAGGLSVSRTSGTRDISLVNVTLADNHVTWSSGAGLQISGSSLTVNLHNTIVADNTDYYGPNNISGSVASGSSYNLIGFGGTGGLSNGTNDNIVLTSSQSAGLTTLGDYGGRTKTHALLSTSLAIDAGSNSIAIAYGLDEDQRGEDRIVDWDEDLDARVDIGAVELAVEELYS